MSTLDPDLHPRAVDGRFARRPGAESDVTLADRPHDVHRDPALSAGWLDGVTGSELQVDVVSQLRYAAGMRGVSGGEAAAVFEQVRSGFDDAGRPSPPPYWLAGLRGRGWREDPRALAGDPECAWALYRVQSDPSLFDDTGVRYASTDLETASAPGHFSPAEGSVIEVSVLGYNSAGGQVDEWSALCRPSQDHLEQFGTGMSELHHIEVADVAGSQHFSTLAPDVVGHLDGSVLLAQNARFEKSWLAHHAGTAGFKASRVAADTFVMARQHLPGLDNHKLATVCARLGVDYGSGHRARHDARAAAESFFALRRRIFSDFERTYGPRTVSRS